MSKLELTSLNCTNCGASLHGYEGKNEIQCEYCNTRIKVLRPRSVTVTQGNLSSDNYDRLNNYVEILQKAIRAGNYNEGYEYCNKALEVNPNIGAIWENKAICAFWRSVSFLNEDKITISNAREIRTFLSASKENDPNSETYEITADAIGGNLATILQLKMSTTSPDVTTTVNKTTVKSYSVRALSRIKDYLETMETAFDIMVNKDADILKYIVNELSNHGKVEWWKAKNALGKADDPSNAEPTDVATQSGIDIARKRDALVKKIQAIDPSYTAPQIKLKLIPAIALFIGIAVAVLFVILSIKK
jgi:DNA-directed RNA polymerase subunit RPC12/RpoP